MMNSKFLCICLNSNYLCYYLLNRRDPSKQFSYRDFKKKLQKVDADFWPFRSSEMHEILCLVIIRVGFSKIEKKNLVIEVVEEL